jgi:hypothetical protein
MVRAIFFGGERLSRASPSRLFAILFHPDLAYLREKGLSQKRQGRAKRKSVWNSTIHHSIITEIS